MGRCQDPFVRYNACGREVITPKLQNNFPQPFERVEMLFLARNGASELTSLSLTDQQVRDLMERMLKNSGRRLDMSSPFVDAKGT